MSDLRTHTVPDAVDAEAWTLRVTAAVDRALRRSAAAFESVPLEALSDALLAVELDGETLPVEHDGPARPVPTATAGRA